MLKIARVARHRVSPRAKTEALVGRAGRWPAIRLASGDTLPADLVVMAVASADVALARRRAALRPGNRRFRYLQTFDPAHLRAASASPRGRAYGLVAPLFDMARSARTTWPATGIGPLPGSHDVDQTQGHRMDLFPAAISRRRGTDEITLADRSAASQKLVPRIQLSRSLRRTSTAAVLQAGPRGLASAAISRSPDFRRGEPRDTCPRQEERVHAPDDRDLRRQRVCKVAIVKGPDKKLFTLDEVRRHTKASSSCGSCTGLVEQILMATAGGDYSAAPKNKAVCGCTDRTHAEVRQAIRDHKLLAIPNAMRLLEWRTPNGCAPAGRAQLYLPGDVAEEAQAPPVALHHERAHGTSRRTAAIR